jgi:HEAT repeat protein
MDESPTTTATTPRRHRLSLRALLLLVGAIAVALATARALIDSRDPTRTALRQLRSSQPFDRIGAVLTLARLAKGPNAATVLSAIIGALEDSSPHVRAAASAQLGVALTTAWEAGFSGPEGPAVVARLEMLLDSPEPSVRSGAEGSLQELASKAPAEWVMNRPGLTRPTLATLEPERSLDALAILAADPRPEVRYVAYHAMGSLGRRQARLPAPPALIAALESETPEGRKFAADALDFYRAGVDDAVPILFRLAEATEGRAEIVRLMNLKSLHPSPAVVPLLIEKLHHPRPTIRACAATMLGGLGPAAEPAVPDLISLLDEPPPPPTELQRQLLDDAGHNPAAAAALSLRRLAPSLRQSQDQAAAALRDHAERHPAPSTRRPEGPLR